MDKNKTTNKGTTITVKSDGEVTVIVEGTKTTYSKGTVMCVDKGHLKTKEPTIHLTKKAKDNWFLMQESEYSIGSPPDEREFELLTVKVTGPIVTDNERKILGSLNKFVDDGLHLGKTVEFWHNKSLSTMDPGLLNVWHTSQMSAIAFRDGDPEGYRAMHGGV